MLIDKKNKPAILFPQMHKQVLFKHKVSKIRNKATPSLFLPKILTFFSLSSDKKTLKTLFLQPPIVTFKALSLSLTVSPANPFRRARKQIKK
jgi:hypothetical protein